MSTHVHVRHQGNWDISQWSYFGKILDNSRRFVNLLGDWFGLKSTLAPFIDIVLPTPTCGPAVMYSYLCVASQHTTAAEALSSHEVGNKAVEVSTSIQRKPVDIQI